MASNWDGINVTVHELPDQPGAYVVDFEAEVPESPQPEDGTFELTLPVTFARISVTGAAGEPCVAKPISVLPADMQPRGLTERDYLLRAVEAVEAHLATRAVSSIKSQEPSSNDPPSRDEIAKLPRWARVAYAARCARRVLRLFTWGWPGAPEQHRLAVERAIDLAESAAATARAAVVIDAVANVHAAADAAYEAATQDFGLADVHAAADAAYAAKAAAVTANSAAAVSASEAEDYALRAAAHLDDARAATKPLQTASRTSAANRNDLHLLLRLSSDEAWTDDTPVSPDVFGPLWPDGPPLGWPAGEGGEGYRIIALEELTDQQVRFAPPARRQEQVARAEQLLAEIDPARVYPYQFVCYRLTHYKPDAHPDLLIPGADLMHDLGLFVRRVQRTIMPHPMLDPVSPPALVIVWDPAVVTSSQYTRVVAAMNQLARAHGGEGLKRLQSRPFAAPAPVEVPTP